MFNKMMEAENKKTKKEFLGWFVAGALLVLLLAGGAYYYMKSASNYVAVALVNGEVFFGKISYFPKLTLSDVHTIQPVVDPENPGQTSAQIVPLASALWAPKNLQLNRDNVVFISKIGEDSQVMQALNAREAQ